VAGPPAGPPAELAVVCCVGSIRSAALSSRKAVCLSLAGVCLDQQAAEAHCTHHTAADVHQQTMPVILAAASDSSLTTAPAAPATVSHMLRDLGARRPGTLSRVGLGTFVDPRQKGGAANRRSAQAPARVQLVHMPGSGEEALWWVAGPAKHMPAAGTNECCTGCIALSRWHTCTVPLCCCYRSMKVNNKRLCSSAALPLHCNCLEQLWSRCNVTCTTRRYHPPAGGVRVALLRGTVADRATGCARRQQPRTGGRRGQQRGSSRNSRQQQQQVAMGMIEA
jgi:hypothetical protein